MCLNKTYDLEEKVKQLEWDVLVVWLIGRSAGTFTFNIETSQSLHADSSKKEWVVDYGCTHHMENDASLLFSLDATIKNKIYVANDFFVEIVGDGENPCQGDVYCVPSLSANLLLVSQLKQTGKIVKIFQIDSFLRI